MRNVYQIAIIGGGPAASAAAIHALQRGLSVCLIEREVFPRYRPGETLHPGIEPLLKQLGVLTIIDRKNFIRHEGIFVQSNSDIKFQPYASENITEKWLGYQAHGNIFDAVLLNQAKKLGATIFENCSAKQIICDEKKVKGIITDNGTIEAKYIIDASGSWHWLTRQLNIPINFYSKKLIARYGYVSGTCPERDKAPIFASDKNGWYWSANIDKNLYQWTRLNFSNEETHANLLPPELRKLKPIGSTKGADVTWRLIDKTAGPGFFIVGDAGAVLDPSSSHGVLRAIMSGIQAADLIHQIVMKKYHEDIAIDLYNDWLFRIFENDVQKLTLFYHQLKGNECSSNLM